MFRRILVPVDDSEQSSAALEQAIQLARQESARIIGLFVADIRLVEAPYITSLYAGDYVAGADPAAVAAAIEAGKCLTQRGKVSLARMAEQCQQAEVPCETEQAEGNVSQVILDRAEHVDLIIMGRQGEGAQWAGPLLGSTFEAVVRHAPVPVLAVQSETVPIRRILVAFDGSERARDGLQIAAHWAAEQGLHLIILTVDDGHSGRAEAYQEVPDLIEAPDVSLQSLLWKGHPAEQILRAAREEKADLIVLGAYGHTRFLEILFGSTVDQVMRGTTCPILICR